MTAEATPSPPAPGKRRVRKRILIPLVLLGLLLLFVVGLMVRGTWSASVETNPTTPQQGALTQLYHGPEGHTVVRSAIVVDAPPSAVWKVVKDFASHAQFLRHLSNVTATPLRRGGTHLQGTAHSRLWGDWPFEMTVNEQESPDKGEYEALWNESDEHFAVNRGGWTLKPTGKDQTLVVFTLEVEIKKYPSFLVRNVLMDRLGTVVGQMRDEVMRRQH